MLKNIFYKRVCIKKVFKLDISEILIENIGMKRYEHSLRVVDIAIKLAEIYNADIEKVKIAALLHDCAKFQDKISLLKNISDFDIILDNVMQNNEELIHGPLGSKIAEVEYGVLDKEILDSIYYHTIGKVNMTLLDKIIYIADYIEPRRNFPGVDEIRAMAFKDLDESVLMAMDNTILFLIKNNKLIHPNTLNARNYLILDKEIKE